MHHNVMNAFNPQCANPDDQARGRLRGAQQWVTVINLRNNRKFIILFDDDF